MAVGSMQGMGRKAELCLSKLCHVCGTEAKTEYSGERSTCDATTADGAQEQRNGNVWVPQIFLSVSLGVLVVEGGQESDDLLGGAWGNSSKDLSLLLTCCCHLAPFPSPCIPCVTQRAPHSSPEHEVAPTESPDTAKRHEGTECWHRRGQQAEAKESMVPPAHPHPCLEGLCVLLPSGSPFLHFCPRSCFRTAKALAHRLLAAQAARHEQFYLPLLTHRGLLGKVLT